VKTKQVTELGPNDIVRKRDGAKYFGYKHTQIDEQIKRGAIPKPIKLGPRAVGWLGSQIIDWQRRLVEDAGGDTRG
jgi:predicted DNA-binding transcriptional regulator AlpA